MKLRDNSQRARWILIIFYIMLAVSPLVLISDILQYNLLSGTYSIEEGETNDNRQMVLAIIYFSLYLLGAIFFILWFRRAYYNLRAAGVSTLHSDGWAAGAWFVPILNLFRPYQIMEEIWDQTQREIGVETLAPKMLIGIWWGLWVVGGIIDRISSRMSTGADTIEELQNSTFWGIVTDGFTLVTLILIILIIRQVSKWEDSLYSQSFEMPLEDHLI